MAATLLASGELLWATNVLFLVAILVSPEIHHALGVCLPGPEFLCLPLLLASTAVRLTPAVVESVGDAHRLLGVHSSDHLGG